MSHPLPTISPRKRSASAQFFDLRAALVAAGWEMEDLAQGFKLKRTKTGSGAKA